MGLNTFRTAYTMKDGTVVNEQAAFEGYIRNGGGFVAIHGADDSMAQLAVLPRHARRRRSASIRATPAASARTAAPATGPS